MARSPGAVGMFDVRTAEILQDVMYASNPCAPGIAKWRHMDHIYGQPIIDEIRAQSLRKRKKRARNHDGPRDWIAVLAATIIVGTILGIMHSYSLFIPSLKAKFDLGLVACIMIGAGAYGIMILFTPLASASVGCMGHRLTCMLGIFLFFVGIVLLALAHELDWHFSLVFVAHMGLMGIGGSFAYTGAITAVVDRFQRRLLLALFLLSFASPLGTAGIYGILTLVFTGLVNHAVYQLSMIILGSLVLCCLLATFSFPARVVQRSVPGQKRFQSRNQLQARIQKCADEVFARGPITAPKVPCHSCIPPPYDGTGMSPAVGPVIGGKKSMFSTCLCIIYVDVSVLSDLSFLVWGAIVFFAAISVFVPYMFLLFFAAIKGASPHPPAAIVFCFCLTSLIGRALLMLSTDHRFIFNRITFQFCMIMSGLVYIAFIWCDTTGWVLVWGSGIGLIEGLLVTVIPRVTLQTVPRPWMASSWVFIVIFSAFGIVIGVAVVLSIWISTLRHSLGFTVIGAAQIIAALLAFLLPSEEPDVSDPSPCYPQQGFADRFNHVPPKSRRRGYSFRSFGDKNGNSGYNYNSSYNNNSSNGNSKSYESYDSSFQQYQNSSFMTSSRTYGKKYLGLGLGSSSLNSKSYTTDCPICSKIGCIPGCSICTPGGLTSGAPISTPPPPSAP